MKKLLILLAILFFASGGAAQITRIDESTKKICNQAMLSIYNHIVDQAENYPELESFNKSALSENQYGIYTIEYDNKNSSEAYAFGLTVVSLEDDEFKDIDAKRFNLGFPLLGLKFTGYQNRNREKNQFNIRDPLKEFGQVLWDQQQLFMPFRLSLKPVKRKYESGEDIEFIVTLTNMSSRNYRVKALNKKTLYFKINGQEWGAKEVNKKKTRNVRRVELLPEKSIRKRFKGRGIKADDEIEIFCAYAMTHKGVQPSARIKIKVEK